MPTAPGAARRAAPLLRDIIRTRRESAIAEFLAAYPDEYDPARVREIVASPPAEIQHRLLRLLRAFHGKVYQQDEARVLPLLRADVEAKTALAGAMPAGDLIERGTGGERGGAG